MKQVRGALRLIARELHDLGRAYAIVGGFGVSARATPRTTRDVDVAVAVIDDADAEQLVFVLQSRGFRLVTAIEQSGTSRLATARTLAPGSDVLVDS